MTSGESFDSNNIPTNGINLENIEPSFIVLPIPENCFGFNTFEEINVCWNDNTTTSFRFNPAGSLMPEILTSDGQ